MKKKKKEAKKRKKHIVTDTIAKTAKYETYYTKDIINSDIDSKEKKDSKKYHRKKKDSKKCVKRKEETQVKNLQKDCEIELKVHSDSDSDGNIEYWRHLKFKFERKWSRRVLYSPPPADWYKKYL